MHTHDFDSRLILFSEFNPNPIIGLNLLGEFIFVNLSARTQFPTLVRLGKKHPVLSVLIDELSEFKHGTEELIIFSRDVFYLNNIYDQQIFAMPKRNVIFIYMNDVTEQRHIEEELKLVNAKLEEDQR